VIPRSTRGSVAIFGDVDDEAVPMLQEIDLRALAEMHGPERAFVSLYASTGRRADGLTARESRIRATLEETPDEAQHFEESMRLLRAWLEENAPEDEPVCAFACWALDFAQGYVLPVAPPDMLRVGASPYLRPLAEMQDEHENFVIVAADNRGTRIFAVTSAVPEARDRVRGDVKNRVKKGGWSQMRYARRREKQLHAYAKEVAEVLAQMERNEDFDRIVLLGSKEALAEIREALPAEVARKVVGEQAVNLHEGEGALFEKAYGLFFDEEREAERRLWDRIREEVHREGLAATGPGEVLKAALAGRVDSLLVTRDAKLAGTRCRDCDAVIHEARKSCAACKSSSVFEVDLVNTLVRQMELTRGGVEFTDPIPGLSKLGDVAALLRW
jgi:peptide chain release factor subunit 1